MVLEQSQSNNQSDTVVNNASEETSQSDVISEVLANREAATAEGKAEPEVKEEPKLILGKFKNQEDLEKSYQELEAHKTKIEQEKAELEKRFYENQPQQERQEPQEQQEQSSGFNFDEFLANPNEVWQKSVAEEVRRLTQPQFDYFAGLIGKQMEDKLKRDNPVIAENEKEINEYLMKHPEKQEMFIEGKLTIDEVVRLAIDVQSESKIQVSPENEQIKKTGALSNSGARTPDVGSEEKDVLDIMRKGNRKFILA